MKPSRSYRSEVQVLNLLPYKSVISSVAQSCLTLCDPMDYTIPGFPVHHQLPELAQTHVHRIGDAIQPSHPLWSSLLRLPSIFPSIRVFSKELVFTSGGQSVRVSASAFILPMNIQGWFLVWSPCCPGTLKSLLQHHSSKASILQHSAFFTVQLSHLYMTTGKKIALTKWTFFWQSNVSSFQYTM